MRDRVRQNTTGQDRTGWDGTGGDGREWDRTGQDRTHRKKDRQAGKQQNTHCYCFTNTNVWLKRGGNALRVFGQGFSCIRLSIFEYRLHRSPCCIHCIVTSVAFETNLEPNRVLRVYSIHHVYFVHCCLHPSAGILCAVGCRT